MAGVRTENTQLWAHMRLVKLKHKQPATNLHLDFLNKEKREIRNIHGNLLQDSIRCNVFI